MKKINEKYVVAQYIILLNKENNTIKIVSEITTKENKKYYSIWDINEYMKDNYILYHSNTLQDTIKKYEKLRNMGYRTIYEHGLYKTKKWKQLKYEICPYCKKITQIKKEEDEEEEI